mmetsp:Transcript_43228/g.100846  ORF Transcript_43228/g.100846 Transcript_43228/m.100846 type:complete len:254 (+) Transcript_43228:773-1534(+)
MKLCNDCASKRPPMNFKIISRIIDQNKAPMLAMKVDANTRSGRNRIMTLMTLKVRVRRRRRIALATERFISLWDSRKVDTALMMVIIASSKLAYCMPPSADQAQAVRRTKTRMTSSIIYSTMYDVSIVSNISPVSSPQNALLSVMPRATFANVPIHWAWTNITAALEITIRPMIMSIGPLSTKLVMVIFLAFEEMSSTRLTLFRAPWIFFNWLLFRCGTSFVTGLTTSSMMFWSAPSPFCSLDCWPNLPTFIL